MTDRELLLCILKSNPSSKQTEVLGEQLAMLETGLVDKLMPSVRRHAEAIARAKGLMPPLDEKAERRKRNISTAAGDCYFDKRTPGTAFGEQLTERYRKRIHTGVQAKLGIVDPGDDKDYVRRCLAAVERKGAA